MALGTRTTTWDRPPLARTTTLLERSTPAGYPPLAEGRADSYGITWVQPPRQVPPTTLQELRPLAAPPLQRLGTWSQAPPAPAAAWRPLPVSSTATARTVTAGVPQLQRACTNLPAAVGPSGILQPVAPRPVLQRASTLGLARTVTVPAAVPQPLPPRPRPVQRPSITQEQVPELGRLLLQSALWAKEGPPKQLRLIIGGLMGSGKSTICRMLRQLLQGTWVNQDEFSHLGKGAKKAFLAAIRKAATDDSVQVLLVDKINTMKQHREEILEAMGGVGNVVYVQVKVAADGDGWDRTLRLCESRIAQRGDGHRTLKAKTPQLKQILQRTVKSAEPLGDEFKKLVGVLTVDMMQNSIVQVMKLIQDLDELGVLTDIYDLDMLNDQQLLSALEASKRVERELAADGAQEKKEKKEKESGPWYWALKLKSMSSRELLEQWRSCEDFATAASSGIHFKEDHHVTLLYLGGGKDEEVAKRNGRLAGPEAVAQLREEFQGRQGEAMQLEVSSILWEEGRACCAAALLKERTLCANEYPHITLGTAARVNAVVSNELLARKAATEDLPTGLQAWLQLLGLGQYAGALASWCQSMGAASPEELAEFAPEAAAAVEADTKAQEHIAEVLRKAVERPIHTVMLASPLQLTGILQGMARGQ